jgi:hypothetical protein
VRGLAARKTAAVERQKQVVEVASSIIAMPIWEMLGSEIENGRGQGRTIT